MLWFGWFFPLPCLRAPGRGVPGFLAGPALVLFLLLLLVHDPNLFCHNFHQDVSRFTVHKGLRPNSRIMYRFFTSHQPMMNEQDQVTWTNWPASKKNKEIASWRLNHAGHWQEQTEPSLSIFYLETKIEGKSADMKPVRLRLILVPAVEIRGAESWLGPLRTFGDLGQTYPWMPRQNTESLLLWAYAADGDSPFLWLGPKSAQDDQTMVLNKEVPTFPLRVFFSLMHGESAQIWR